MYLKTENMCEYTCGWKKKSEIHIMLFKNWKHVFESVYQSGT